MVTPWWYCNTCHLYYATKGNDDPKRVPMRNKFEGMYTRWHFDIGFKYLRDKVAELYPDLRTLPSVEEALEWQSRYKDYVTLLKESDAGDVLTKKKNDAQITEVKQWLTTKEFAWSPPPHKCPWKSPIPLKYFHAATGTAKKWSLPKCSREDLVPVEQVDLLQDVPNLPEIDVLQSAESRACVSLCRPYGRFVNRRKEKGRGNAITTQKHQSGELCLRPLTPDEDVARGMLTGIVADDETLQEKFKLKPSEQIALPVVLEWLGRYNPWNSAYANSLQDVKNCQEFCETLAAEGCKLPSVASLQTVHGEPAAATLGNEKIAAVLPLDDMNATRNSYRHLRAGAHIILQAKLTRPLPKQWQDVHESDLTNAHGDPFLRIPKVLRNNMSFTAVSLYDINLDAKVFVDKYMYGTGSYASTLDCVCSRNVFYASCLYSLDEAFHDGADPEWCFFQRERELKTRLYRDYMGRGSSQSAFIDNSRDHHKVGTAQETGVPVSNSVLYSTQKFSRRIGLHISDSPQALRKVQYDWLEIAAPENLGAPVAMTTITSNQRTSNISAHVRNGPFANPNPDDSVASLRQDGSQLPLQQNIFVQVVDYMRRRKDFMSYAYRQGYDAMRGRLRCHMRRREHQKRGPPHDHINEFPEQCGQTSKPLQIPMEKCSMAPHSLSASDLCTSYSGRCCSVSRYCLKSDAHCRLPTESSGAPYHMQHHVAPATAEMVRPYPLGSFIEGPSMPPDLRGNDVLQTIRALNSVFWTDNRCTTGVVATPQSTCTGTLKERVFQILDCNYNSGELQMNSPMLLQDLIVAYYYRRLQTQIVPHKCSLGYCRNSWSEPCKFGLPCTQVTTELQKDFLVYRFPLF